MPGLKVVLPSTPRDAYGLLKTAIRDDNPVYYMEHRLLYDLKGDVSREEFTIPFGQADVKREGSDLTIVATLHMVHKSLAVAARLAERGEASVEVVDPRTLVPFDEETVLASVRKTGRLLVVQEAALGGGFGSEMIGPYRDQLRATWPIIEAAGAAALGDFTTRRYFKLPGQDPVPAVELQARGGLPNLAARLKAGQAVTIVDFAGGNHAQGGWTDEFAQWLRQQYPAAEIQMANASIQEIHYITEFTGNIC